MKRVAIISKPGGAELEGVVRELSGWLHEHNYSVVADKVSEAFCSPCERAERQDLAGKGLDFVIVLGGDGTLLSTARSLARSGTPILGVNLGSLGFLTEVKREEMHEALEAIDAGACDVSVRSMIHCQLRRGDDCVAGFEALNDVVVHQSALARLTDFDVRVNGAFVANYKADGLIISTPTGSTAYSLAAGGPILSPDVPGFVITPVAPHALTNRPLVVQDTAVIDIMVAKAGDASASLTVDGQQGLPMKDGDIVQCRKSDCSVKLLKLAERSFFDVLRTKLKWGER
ncbi:MAG TPA: NAD(+)/NADH kinase [Candidatus Angelobacter sp.]|nr:NAD(+)/NADH kinase [Candidatus Angelobacter sp.]